MSVGVVWFRSDLRIEDNPAWDDATSRHDEVVALHVADPRLIESAGSFRRAAHAGYVAALDAALDGGLTVRSGDPASVVAEVCDEVAADGVYVNGDVTRYAARRDVAAADALRERNLDLVTHWGTLVHPPGTILAGTGRVSRVFTPFHRKWASTAWRPWPTGGPGTVRRLAGIELEVDRAMAARCSLGAVDERLATAVDRAEDYADRHDLPAERGTTELSTDLTFGALSPRTVIESVGEGTGPGALVRQLAWRDWYHHLFAEMPHLVDRPMNDKRADIEWREAPEDVEAWEQGRTGFPLVDAGMRQLAETGWMHNRVRMIAASFLVKDLLVDWRVGERYFRRVLIDGDIPQNAGNWQWVAGSGPDASPFFRVMNPTTQSRRFDPEGEYIRRWVPELEGLAAPAIHDPSTAAPLDLAAAGIELGTTYPRPLVDHAEARLRALDAYGVGS